MNIFVGDSHVRQFHIDLPGDFTVSWFSGATAKGLGNIDSHLKTGSFIRELVQLKSVENLSLMFGNVDIDFSLYKKIAENPRIDLDMFIAEVIESYVNYVSSLNFSERICVLASHLSPLNDKFFVAQTSLHAGIGIQSLTDVVSDLGIDHAWRNSKTLYFNDLLESNLLPLGVELLRIDKDMFGAGQVIQSRFTNGGDHHCRRSATLALWQQKLATRLPIIQHMSFN